MEFCYANILICMFAIICYVDYLKIMNNYLHKNTMWLHFEELNILFYFLLKDLIKYV